MQNRNREQERRGAVMARVIDHFGRPAEDLFDWPPTWMKYVLVQRDEGDTWFDFGLSEAELMRGAETDDSGFAPELIVNLDGGTSRYIVTRYMVGKRGPDFAEEPEGPLSSSRPPADNLAASIAWSGEASEGFADRIMAMTGWYVRLKTEDGEYVEASIVGAAYAVPRHDPNYRDDYAAVLYLPVDDHGLAIDGAPVEVAVVKEVYVY